MRSRLGISISVSTLDLVECGPAADEGQSPNDHIPLYFIAAPSTAARRPSGERSFSGEGLSDYAAPGALPSGGTGASTGIAWDGSAAAGCTVSASASTA